MNATNCKTVRYEIDEADLNQQLSGSAAEHLQACPACRGFHDERRRLRSLMSSLETVAAPADFDFRLRARLARQKDRASGFAFSEFSIGARSLAAVALVLLIVVGGVIVRNRMLSTNNSAVRGVNGLRVSTPEEAIKATTPATSPEPTRIETAIVAPKDSGKIGKRIRPGERRVGKLPERAGRQVTSTVAQNKAGVRDSSLLPPSVVVPKYPTDAVLVSTDAPSFRISINNGRGTARTISLPRFSFGSQRVLGPGFSFAAPKSPGKGAW
jgi:hypothetical protein